MSVAYCCFDDFTAWAGDLPIMTDRWAQLMNDKPKIRKSMPKSVRFEVFKRDSFKCQYCGNGAPDVLLQIDHIKPLSKGGTDDITNLITACQPCNSGKSDKLLDENTAVAKSRAQSEELQERREQREMMMAWVEGLREIRNETIDNMSRYWHDLAPGFTINETGRGKLKTWIRKFSVQEVCHAMDIASEQYLEYEKDATVTSESWELAFGKIPGICRVERASTNDPDIKELYYIRGILRKRLEGCYFDNARALEWLKAARGWDVPLDDLRDIAKRSSSWTQFSDALDTAIDEQKELQTDDSEDNGE